MAEKSVKLGPQPDRHAIAWEAGAEWALSLIMNQSKTREEVCDDIGKVLMNGRRLRAEAIKRNR